MPACPNCGSQRVWKDGLRYTINGSFQRYVCRECGYRFTENSAKQENRELLRKFVEDLECQDCDESQRRALVSLETISLAGKAIALSEEKAVDEKRAAGATEAVGDVKGKLVEFAWWMKKRGYKESTILSRVQRLQRLVKLDADLFNPESVAETIARQDEWSEARKEAMVYAYDLFAKWLGLKWQRPVYKPPRKIPFIPLEREIDDLIACCNKHVAAFLQVAKETGARAGEIFALKWTDVDFETRTLRITAEKGSEPRIFKVSTRLVAMLNQIPKEGERIFSHYKRLQNLRRSFDRYRKRAAHKLGNPRLLQVHFHTLRHWKGTMEYHKTKDILHVMQVLGHKQIKNTLLYTQLVKFEENDEFVCKVARNPEEIQALIEAGFEYVLQKDGLAYFRKRK